MRSFIATLCLGVALSACSNAGIDNSDSDSRSSANELDVWPKLDGSFMIDPAIEAQITDIMSRMTLEQKVGQVIQGDSTAVTPEDVKTYHLGSVLSGGNSAPGELPYAKIEQWVEAADAYYLASVDESDVDVAIPVIWGIDAVHGHGNVIGATIFPHNIGLGAARNPDLIRDIAAVTARELRATGHDWTFAPTVAVPQDDRWGRTYEGFGEHPEIVASYAGKIVEGIQGNLPQTGGIDSSHVISTAKHFLADGGTDMGKDQGDALAPIEELVRIHNAGYPPALDAGALSVMASFSSWKGQKVHGSKYLLTDALKDRMDFQGFIVGDWNAHGQIPGCTNENCPDALEAGLDMYMAPDSWKGLYINLLAQAKSGEVSMDRLDDAVRRILRAKIRYGLFDMGKPSERPLAGDRSVLGAAAHKAVARQAVRESLVLLKNENQTLPLAPSLNILVTGEGANDISKQAGGWTLTWQGGGLDNDLFPSGESIFSGIKKAVTKGGGSAVLSEDGSYSQKPDVAIVVFGEDPYAEFQGDVSHVGYDPFGQKEVQLLRDLQSQGIKTVSVFLSGRPLWVNPELNASDAFVAAWLPGSEGAGIADVLFSDENGHIAHDFKGKLSFSWPKSAGQTPLNYGDANYDPLFAYGFGLNYADAKSLPTLDEAPGIDLSAAGLNLTLFKDGLVQPPWALDVTGNAKTSAVDHLAQEDALKIEFTGAGTTSISTSDPVDLSRETTAALELSFNIKRNTERQGMLTLSASCPDDDCKGSLDISQSVDGLGTDWKSVRISLSCFRNAGADMSSIKSPFTLSSTGPAAVSISNLHIAEDDNGLASCAF
ncbi:exo-1,4-beta-glucosidase [Litorimonas taeanensis]|uniref:Exo-1,4-beta-glucosidase n=2 Tax=Litorimonas taeanensis TaxID=568099 RepID=A0A420WJS5_9PROT|nr:exo-1,4-beta-glucosidase [Litorimonas taeanensis]